MPSRPHFFLSANAGARLPSRERDALGQGAAGVGHTPARPDPGPAPTPAFPGTRRLVGGLCQPGLWTVSCLAGVAIYPVPGRVQNRPWAAGELQAAGPLLKEPQAEGGQLGSTGCNCQAPEGPVVTVAWWPEPPFSQGSCGGGGEAMIKALPFYLSAIFIYPRASPIWQQLESEAYVHLIYYFLTVSIEG